MPATTIQGVTELSIQDVGNAYKNSVFSAVELVQTYIARINEVNEKCRAVIEINPEALQQAEACDNLRIQGEIKGSLHGIPVLIKDIFNTNDRMQTAAGSLALDGAHLGEESVVTQRLRQAGAIILGTTNLSEWANFRSGATPNGWSARGGQSFAPYCDMQDPSGSSSGSAIAARLGLAAACLGTENNGSITSPSSKSAVVGLKPTVGRVSRQGLWPANEYTDTPGPIARRVSDIASILSVIADPHSPDESINFTEALSHADLSDARLAVPRTSILDSVNDQEILDQFDRTLDLLRASGAQIVDNVSYPTWTRAWNAETMSFIYGELKKQMADYFHRLKVNPHGIQSIADLISYMESEPREKLTEFGATVFEKANATNLSDEELEELFQRRLAKGSEVQQILDSNECDALIVPAQCHNPSDLGQLPVLCMPMGFFSENHPVERDQHGYVTRGPNIPFGILFIGRKWDEASLLRLGHAYEQASASILKAQDHPVIMPGIDLQDVVQQNRSKCNLV